MQDIESQRILALITILRYEEARLRGEGVKTQDDFAKKLKIDVASLRGIYFQSNQGQRDNKGSNKRLEDSKRKCLKYFKRVYDELAELPAYIREARNIAFPELAPPAPREPVLHKRAVEAVADVFVRYNLKGYREKTTSLSEKLGGRLFDVYRWAGPSDRSDRRTRSEPRAIRASVKFFHPEARGSFVRFHLHYRPFPIETESWKSVEPYLATGIVVPIEKHILMIGAEEQSRHPLIVVAQFNEETPNQFGGLVVRKADSKDQIFSSRVLFRRNEELSGDSADAKIREGVGPRLNQLDDKIGIIWETDLSKEEKSLLRDFVNYDDLFDGKLALTLQKPV